MDTRLDTRLRMRCQFVNQTSIVCTFEKYMTHFFELLEHNFKLIVDQFVYAVRVGSLCVHGWAAQLVLVLRVANIQEGLGRKTGSLIRGISGV